jgi:hypothetical protein
MDVLNRIKYDAGTGAWKVISQGKELGTTFKSSAEAFAHLQSILKPNPTQAGCVAPGAKP